MHVGIEEYMEVVEKKRKLPKYNVEKPAIKPVLKKFDNIRVVLFDIYGTIITTKVVDLDDGGVETTLGDVVKEFGFGDALKKMNPGVPEERTLGELFKKTIEDDHEEKRRQGIAQPEIILEKIWESMINKLIENGYRYNERYFGSVAELALKAMFFQDYSWQYDDAYPGGATSLFELKKRGIELGIVSNAHRFTQFDIMRQLNMQTRRKISSLDDLFNSRIVVFSYQLGEAKPSHALIKKAIEGCRKMNIEDEQVMVVGNDLLKDLWVAKKESPFINTVLFAGDKNSLKLRRGDKRLKGFEPDAIITELSQLSELV